MTFTLSRSFSTVDAIAPAARAHAPLVAFDAGRLKVAAHGAAESLGQRLRQRHE